jgi:hypothetical protein
MYREHVHIQVKFSIINSLRTFLSHEETDNESKQNGSSFFFVHVFLLIFHVQLALKTSCLTSTVLSKHNFKDVNQLFHTRNLGCLEI